jgi:putative lipoprotein
MTKSFGPISGTASYLNRMALPPNASLQVRLENFFTPAPRLLVEVTTPIGSKQVPIPFQIPFNQTDIDPAVRYAVRASVLVDNQPIHTSKGYSVITGNNPLELEIIMQPSNGKTTSKLSETYWKLTEIFGKAAIAASGKVTIVLRNEK